jgi:ankyrin repeat protein
MGSNEIFDLLLSKKKQQNCNINEPDVQGITPLAEAVIHGNFNIITRLVF